jgi:hypothetical protein
VARRYRLFESILYRLVHRQRFLRRKSSLALQLERSQRRKFSQIIQDLRRLALQVFPLSLVRMVTHPMHYLNIFRERILTAQEQD